LRLEDPEALEEYENAMEDGEEDATIKAPRKRGWLETTFDTLCEKYEDSPSEEIQNELMALVAQLEINRRVHFFYDLQKLRVAAGLRSGTYERVFGVKDLFIDHTVEHLERIERQTEKMVDDILQRSPDSPFYNYLINTYRGVGTMMAGCIISEVSAPERFHSVSALWKYAGLAVLGNDVNTGSGGHAQYRKKGEKAEWNHFLRTKLLGVLASCMTKAQMPYYTGFAGKYNEKNAPSPDLVGLPKPHPKDPSKCVNVKVMMDYKMRLSTRNEMIPEDFRVYNIKGREIFQYRKDTPIQAFDKNKKPTVDVIPSQLSRKSKGHINKMASRYMIKMFITDILNKWREYKGFVPLLTYDEAKLRGGIPHKGLNLIRINPEVRA